MAARMNNLRVVCLGHSIVGPPRQQQTSYRAHFLKFTDLLQLMLEARLGRIGVEVTNAGWAGDCTEPIGGLPGAAARLETDVITFAPQVCVIMLGCNDARQGIPSDRFKSNLQAIYQRLLDRKIRILALLSHGCWPAPEHHALAWGMAGQQAGSYDHEVQEVAARCGVPMCDPFPLFREAVAAGVDPGQLVDPVDGVHLRPGGEMLFARCLFDRFDALGWIEQT